MTTPHTHGSYSFSLLHLSHVKVLSCRALPPFARLNVWLRWSLEVAATGASQTARTSPSSRSLATVSMLTERCGLCTFVTAFTEMCPTFLGHSRPLAHSSSQRTYHHSCFGLSCVPSGGYVARRALSEVGSATRQD